VKNAGGFLLGSSLLALASWMSASDLAIAQTTVSLCQPPQPDEYLLFVFSKSAQSQEQIRRVLPANTQLARCRHLNDTVTRISGFRRLEDAESWALYVQDIVGLSAFVVRPSSARVSPTNSQAYNPKLLGEGYAVIVNYFNKPEIAAQLREILGSDIGLASYGQRPYLLAIHTTNQQKANATLQKLSDRGFWSMVVDSRRVTLLKSMVSF
jgi:hypothetical protein